jgi:uncharacterized protein
MTRPTVAQRARRFKIRRRASTASLLARLDLDALIDSPTAVTPLDEDLFSRWNEPALDAIVQRDAVNALDRHGASALWHAVYFGRADWVARLLDAGADLDAHDPVAIDRVRGSGHVVSVWQGIPAHAPDTPSGRGTLLHAAVARVVSLDVVGLLLDRGVAIDARDRFGATALHIAAFRDAPEALELLLARGADVNAADRVGYTALDHAHLKLDTIRVLLRHGAHPDGARRIPWPHSSLGWSTFTYAAQSNRVDVLNALLDAGARVELHPEALPLAAKHGSAEAVRRLLAAGADLTTTTEWRGRASPPLEAAAMYASVECARHLLPRCRDELDRALEAAVDFSREDMPEPPNDRHAARRELVTLLLDAGARATAALHIAAEVDEAWYATTLLARGADANARDDEGRTALLRAAARGRHEVVRALLSAGADPRACGADGATAYEVARRAYRDEKVDDARLVMQALDAVGAGPEAPTPVAAPPPAVITLGSTVRHAKFGEGRVMSMTGSGDEQKLTIEFASVGSKTLLARFVTEVRAE